MSTETTMEFKWDYAPAPEAKDHAKIKKQYDLFINGQWVKPSTKKYFDTISPSSEEKLSEVAEAGEKDVDLAVKAARQAYEKTWKKCRPKNARNTFSELRA
jgi:aldehyde dehydrogenase (NAD+)